MYQNQYDSLFPFKSKEGTVTENVVEHRKKNDSFNSNHEVNDDGKETTEDAMEMPILPDSDLEAVLNSLSSGKDRYYCDSRKGEKKDSCSQN